MPRKYTRKSERGKYSDQDMQKAVDLVITNKMSLRAAAKQCGLNYKTVQRNVEKQKAAHEGNVSFAPRHNHKQVFNNEEEQELADYIKDRSDLGYGLTILQVRELAYDFAVANKKVAPKSWGECHKAGPDWYEGFMNRHPQLSARKPEQCSIARAAAFNKPVITEYFKILKVVMERNPRFADGSRVFNADETSTSTAGAVRAKIVSPKGVKQVHQIKGQERGTSVTTCFFICAQGSFLPPVMILPRKNVNSGMSKEAYPGTLCLANQSGWMTRDIFVEAIKHFIRHSSNSKENPSLLICDNVDSHLTVETIRLCKENGVTLFTVPPHTTHKTQPLDVGVYGPFQCSYDKAIHLWTLNHPGEPATIYEVAGFVKAAACESMKAGNILSAFAKTGIIPFNDKIFQDHEYVKSNVTFIPEEENLNEEEQEQEAFEENINQESNNNKENSEEGNENVTPEATNAEEGGQVITESNTSKGASKHVSPRDLWGVPKLVRKESKRKPRRQGKSTILTDTPEKEAIEKRENDKKQKEEEKNNRKRAREEKALQKLVDQRLQAQSKPKGNEKQRPAKRAKTSKKLFSSSESENEGEIQFQDESYTWEETEDVQPLDGTNFPPLQKSPKEGEYVLVEFSDRKNKFFYAAKVLKEEDKEGDLEVSYLRRSVRIKDKFSLPDIPDLKSVHKSDVKLILPKPTCSGTRRQQNLLHFDVDFSFIAVK